MTEMDDDTMRRLLRAVDPASSLADLQSDRIGRLTEDTMTEQNTTTAAAGGTADRMRSRRWALGGGLVALAAGAAAAIIIPMGFGASDATVLTQPVGGGPAAMCAMVEPAAVAGADSAFRAEVTGIEDGTVTLTVLERFSGEVSDTVSVMQGEDSAVDGAAITFEPDATYLIATSEDRIITCGVSGIESAELDVIYDEAFPG